MLAWLDSLLARAVRWLGAGKLSQTLPCLDLHGMGVKRALAETAAFLAEAQDRGWERVRIVYGKGRHSAAGRGVLREVVPRWLAAEGQKWVERFSPVLEPHGEEGSVEVTVRKKSPDSGRLAGTRSRRPPRNGKKA